MFENKTKNQHHVRLGMMQAISVMKSHDDDFANV